MLKKTALFLAESSFDFNCYSVDTQSGKMRTIYKMSLLHVLTSSTPSPFSAAVNVSQLLVNRSRYCPLPLSPFLSDNIYIVQQDLLHTWACVAMIGSFSAVSHHVTLLDIRFRLLLGYYSIF